MRPVGVAVVGAGYWGPNLCRNFNGHPRADLQVVCDLDVERARRVVGPRSTVRVTASLTDVLDDSRVEAVAVATPAATHASIAAACLRAGKHVLVEKPLAASAEDGAALVAEADAGGLVLMCDHTYCYTPAVQRLRDLISQGRLGEVHYLDSVRINLGLIQPDVDVFWDLAPHDLSVLDVILPGGCRPVTVAAQGADPIGAGLACVGYLTLRLSSGATAHIHVNWLSPTKIRTTIVGGSKQIAVWDDLNPAQRLSVYDKGVDLHETTGPDARRDRSVSYRIGDMVAPVLQEREALHGVVEEFTSAIRERRRPLTDGTSGLRVLRTLEAIPRSVQANGAAVPLLAGQRHHHPRATVGPSAAGDARHPVGERT